jgi:hypothetical protein
MRPGSNIALSHGQLGVTGLFALGGVVVGGVLNNMLAHRLEKRRAGWEGKTKARLFAPTMMRLSMAIGAALDER